MSFVHLHTHSHYSLLDGLPTIPKLVAEAKRHKMPALAITDHGALYGAIEFYQECLKNDIKPIIGIEGYLTDGDMHQQERIAKPYHLILLAKSKTGYKNLLKLVSAAHLEGFYYKPRFDWETLEQYSEGLIALTACLGGPIARPIVEGHSDEAEKNLQRLKKIFGSEDLYLEMQHRPSIPEQSLVNSELKILSKKHGVPLVATNDSHYLHIEDAQAHDVLICLQTKKKISDTDRMTFIGEDYSLLSDEEMRHNFSDTPEAVDNSANIAERCNIEIELEKINLPYFEVPGGMSADEYLQELCQQGIRKRYNIEPAEASETIQQRLRYELEIIRKTGFSDYFLIVQDIVNFAKNNGIMVGPGRGSAAGSLVSYLLNITNIDPLTYDLLFERFLNPERISMPDIDMDFADSGRDQILHYIEHKYGKDRVAQIITFGTMASRAAVRDVGRVLNVSYNYCDRLAKLIPMFMPLQTALEKVDELKQIYAQDPEAKRLLDLALKVEGVARHSSTHACAVIITKEPLVNHVPLQYSTTDDEAIISQYSMYPVEKLGLLKIDVLGLKNLTILQTAAKLVEQTTGTVVDLDRLPLHDQATFELLQRGQTVGIFQLESSGMTRYLKQLKPTEIEDVIAMISLYRPGPMQFIEDYIAGKQGKKKSKYLHPKLVNILSKTYGIAIYQEQVLQIARELAGFTYGEADILRRAVGKKIKKLLLEQADKMIKGMTEHGIDKHTAEKIWDFILPFARYGFNRSHAASYAIIAYQTAYLKSHYPAQFMAALMSADQGDIESIAKEIMECERMGLKVRPPDISESFSSFTVVMDADSGQPTNNIRFGLQAIKNVGHHIADAIITVRESGPFLSIEDFLHRIQDKDLNKKSLESLIKCGALDTLGDRAQLLGNIDNLLAFNRQAQSGGKKHQENLFADLPLAAKFMKLKMETVPPLEKTQILAYEKELLGLYISDHPFKNYLPQLAGRVISLAQASSMTSSSALHVAGIITLVKKISTRDGKPMMFVTLEDSTATVEIIVFPKLLATTAAIWTPGTMVRISGNLSDKDGVPKILAETVEILNDEALKKITDTDQARWRLWLTLPIDFDKDKMHQVKTLIERHPGSVAVYMILSNGQQRKIRTDLKVSFSQDVQTQLESIIGIGSVRLER